MKYCQGPTCHEYKTKDRIRGSKGDKHYETRKSSTSSSRLNYLGGNACSMACERDWFEKFGERAVQHFGRIVETIKLNSKNAWHKRDDYNTNTHKFDIFYCYNSVTDERRPITKQQYDNDNFTLNSS